MFVKWTFCVSGSEWRLGVLRCSWTQRTDRCSGASRLLRLFVLKWNKCLFSSRRMCRCLFQGYSGPVGPVGMIGPVGKPVSRWNACALSLSLALFGCCTINDVLDGFSGCQRAQRKPWRDGRMCSYTSQHCLVCCQIRNQDLSAPLMKYLHVQRELCNSLQRLYKLQSTW